MKTLLFCGDCGARLAVLTKLDRLYTGRRFTRQNDKARDHASLRLDKIPNLKFIQHIRVYILFSPGGV